MEMLKQPLAMALPENRRQLRESERRDLDAYKPDPSLSRQQRRLAERMAAKARDSETA